MGVPSIASFLFRKLQPKILADSVDFINYYITPFILIVAAFAITTKQYFGSPIRCWSPAQFRGGWDQYAEDFCFIQNFYYVPIEEPIPDDQLLREDQISYYRWGAFVLVIQAAIFIAPGYLWDFCSRNSVLRPMVIVQEAGKCAHQYGSSRENRVAEISAFLYDFVTNFDKQKRYRRNVIAATSGYNLACGYLFMKFLYVVNIFGQITLINYFIGGRYEWWAFQAINDLIHTKEWTASSIFPRVIMCDFQIRELGTLHRHTLQCVVMVNMLLEKFYIFLWFWLIAVAVVTIINFLYYLCVLLIGSIRSNIVLWYINREDKRILNTEAGGLERFVNFLRPDGILIFKLIQEHADIKIARDILKYFACIYKANYLYTDADALTSITTDNDTTKGSSDRNIAIANGKTSGGNRRTLRSSPYEIDGR